MITPQRLTKTTREIEAMRAAGRLLSEICSEAGRFVKSGRKEYEIVADIDRLARDKGAEDLRILAGENRLNPPSFKQSLNLGNYWAVYLAVQHERYWVEAGRSFILSNEAEVQNAYDQAQKSVAAMARELKPGGAVAAIEIAGRGMLGELYPKAALYGLANGIGLNLWEAPFLNEDDAREVGATAVGTTVLKEHMTMALRAAFPMQGKIVLYGDSFEVTAEGAQSLIGG